MQHKVARMSGKSKLIVNSAVYGRPPAQSVAQSRRASVMLMNLKMSKGMAMLNDI